VTVVKELASNAHRLRGALTAVFLLLFLLLAVDACARSAAPIQAPTPTHRLPDADDAGNLGPLAVEVAAIR